MTSIWLQPQPRQQQDLQRLVARMAGEFHTVSLTPHLTVCGVPGSLEVLDAAADYVRTCGLLPLRVAKTAVTGAIITPFRAVFIEVENSPELREFRERLRDIVGASGELIPPHVSLLYTLDRVTQAPRPDLDEKTLQAIARRCAESIKDTHLILERPVVNSSGGAGNADVYSWKTLRAL